MPVSDPGSFDPALRWFEHEGKWYGFPPGQEPKDDTALAAYARAQARGPQELTGPRLHPSPISPVHVTRAISRAITAPVATGLEKLGTTVGLPPEQAESYGQTTAETVVPQTFTDWLLLGALGGPGKRALFQAAKAGVAGVTGGLVEGKDPFAQGGLAAGGTLAAEGVLRGAGGVARLVPAAGRWLVSQLGRATTERVGARAPAVQEAFEATAPSVGTRLKSWMAEGVNPPSVSDRLFRITQSGELQRAMSQDFLAGLQATKSLLGPTGDTQFIRSDMLSDVWQALGEKPVTASLGKQVRLAPDPQTGKFGLEQAQALLQEAGQHIRGLKRDRMTLKAQALLERTVEAKREVLRAVGAVNPRAALAFEQARQAYAAGAAFQEILARPGMFTPVPGGMVLSQPQLSLYLATHQRDLVARLGKSTLKDLIELVTRKGQPGAADLARSLGLTRPWVTSRFSLTPGTPGLPLGRAFAGEAPFRPPASVRSLADWLAATQAGRGALEETLP